MNGFQPFSQPFSVVIREDRIFASEDRIFAPAPELEPVPLSLTLTHSCGLPLWRRHVQILLLSLILGFPVGGLLWWSHR